VNPKKARKERAPVVCCMNCGCGCPDLDKLTKAIYHRLSTGMLSVFHTPAGVRMAIRAVLTKYGVRA
jgi:hypothetical protein